MNFLKTAQGKKTILITLIALVVGSGLWVAYNRYFIPESTDVVTTNNNLPDVPIFNTIKHKEKEYFSRLTGIKTQRSLVNRRPLAVMIENHPQARPQAGLEQAEHVWEIIVEGGITRFMGIFSSQDAPKIGPVRSARPYFVKYAAGYHALYAHAGGSVGGLAMIRATPAVVDLPHTKGYFEREPKPGIATEHTLFTSTSKLYELAAMRTDNLKGDFEVLKLTDEAKPELRGNTQKITVNFSSPTYLVEWLYDKKNNVYLRQMAGSPHIDRISGKQLQAKNIVVLTVVRNFHPNINNGKGEWLMTTESTGKALIFMNGKKIEGTWKKPSKDSMLKVFDSNDNEIALIKGKVWWEVIPPDVKVTHTEAPSNQTEAN